MESEAVKRICIDARFYRRATAGVGRYTRGLIHHLQQVDTENDYTVILTPADYAEWPKETTPKNWQIKVLDVLHYSIAEQTTLLHYLNEQQFDLVHFTQFNHPIFYNGPFVVTIHDMIMSIFPLRPLWHPRTWIYRYVMWHAAKKARRVIVPSASTRHDLHRMLGIPLAKMDITLEAIEPEFKPQNDVKRFAELQKKFGLTKPFLLYLNAWRPHKGLPELITAFLKIKDIHDIQLLVAGKPNPAFPAVIEAVEQGKAQTPNILTPGFVSDEDAITLQSMALAFIIPSHYEGFGIPPLEAMACGSPVISAKNSSLPEVIEDAGLYYKTGDSDELAQRIDDLVSNPKLQESFKQKGFVQAKKFSYIKMAQETLAVYKKILASP